MQFHKDQKVAAFVRFSLSVEKWTPALYEGAAVIGETADGSPIFGHKVRTEDGVARNASRCLPLEEALDKFSDFSS